MITGVLGIESDGLLRMLDRCCFVVERPVDARLLGECFRGCRLVECAGPLPMIVLDQDRNGLAGRWRNRRKQGEHRANPAKAPPALHVLIIAAAPAAALYFEDAAACATSGAFGFAPASGW